MKSITTQPEYQKVQELIHELSNDGTLLRFQGACLPAAEITQAILHARGVRSRMVECTALVANSPMKGGNIEVIGFNSIVPLGPNEVDTHFIVLVEAETPFVVDLSIGHKLGSETYVVIAPLDSKDPDIIAEASYKHATVTYRVRKNPRFFTLHQKSMVERLEEDRKIKQKVDKASKLVFWAIGIGVFNAVANTLLVFIKTIVENL